MRLPKWPIQVTLRGMLFAHLLSRMVGTVPQEDELARRVGFEGMKAAVTIATMINTLPMVICNGISTSSIAFTARNIGFRNLHRANEFMRQSFLLVFGLSVVLGVLPYIYAEELVIIFQAKGPVVIESAREYLEVVSLGTITMFMLMQITAALRAVGDGVWPMILLVGANILNIVLDWALVFGKWGFPNLGAPGATTGQGAVPRTY